MFSLRPASHRHLRHHAGYSLMEILAVLVIIGILASTSALAIRGVMARARRNVVKGELATFCNAVDQYEMDTNALPTVAQGLDILTKTTPASAGQPYLKSPPIDPWGRPYQYNIPGRDNTGYEIFSLGADGQEGGDDDIGTWDLARKKAVGTQPE